MLAKIDNVGNLIVKAAIVNGTLTVNGHIVSGNASGTTTAAADTATCTSPPVPTLSGTDTAGTVTVTTGTGCGATGTLASVTFATAYGSAPRITLTPRDLNATLLRYYNGTAATTGFTIDTGTATTDATTYTFNYQVIQ